MVAPSAIAAAAFATGLLTGTESTYTGGTVGTTTYTFDLPAGLASVVASYYFLVYDNPSAAGEDAIGGCDYHHNGASGEVTELTTATTLSTLGGYVDTEIAAIKLKTDLLVTFPANFTDLSISSEDGYVKATTDTGAGIATASALSALAAKFAGITLVKNWLALIMGKTADTTTRTEVNATTAGTNYNETTDSQEAIRDRGDAAWTTGSGGGGGGDVNITITPIQITLTSGQVQNLNLIAHQFAALGSYQFTLVDSQDPPEPVDLTGKTIKLAAFDKTPTPGAALFLVTATVGGADNNVITINQDSTNTQTAGKVNYQVWNVTDRKVYFEGVIDIKPSPTGIS